MAVITPEGIEIPSIEDLNNRFSDQLHFLVEPTLDTSPESPEGIIQGVFASALREGYECLADSYNMDPASCENFKLEFICAITGTRRRGATKSAFKGAQSISVNLNAGVTLPAGSVASVEGFPDIRFQTLTDAINPSGAADDILVEAEAQQTGPIPAYADTLTVIATPQAGWNSVTNPTDVALGRNREEDADLRIRRERELRKPGTGTTASIEVNLLSVKYQGANPITDATVFENTTMEYDSRGLPPKSFEALIWDGVGHDAPGTVIAQVIWDSKPAGIEVYGNTVSFALDRKGRIQPVKYTRPTILDTGVEIIITYDPKTYVGDVAFKQQLADGLKAIARSEMLLRFSAVIDIAEDILGVTSVQSVRIHDFAYPAFTDYQYPLRTYPLFDSADIVLDATPE